MFLRRMHRCWDRSYIILGEAIDGSVVVGTLAITAIVVARRKSTKTQKDRSFLFDAKSVVDDNPNSM